MNDKNIVEKLYEEAMKTRELINRSSLTMI